VILIIPVKLFGKSSGSVGDIVKMRKTDTENFIKPQTS